MQLLLIKPASFSFNLETSSSNIFQNENNQQDIFKKAKEEFQKLVELLINKNISVKIIDDTDLPIKPDAIFPNNWFSSHEDGTIVLYPMMAANRRLERRRDIIELLHPSKIIDLSFYEQQEKYLEGTGSIAVSYTHLTLPTKRIV